MLVVMVIVIFFNAGLCGRIYGALTTDVRQNRAQEK